MILFLFAFFLNSLKTPFLTATYYGNLPTGLMQLTDFQYPVYLFVPENYKGDRDYALIISFPALGEPLEAHIKYWVSQAKRRSMLVLVPSVLAHENDAPTNFDKWFLGVKEEVQKRYQISGQKVYLVGKKDGAHYAAYLATNYPEQFTAVALLGGSWVGPYEKAIHPSARMSRQRPFFVALEDKDPAFIQKTEQKARQFEKKGYPVYLEKTYTDESLASDDFKKSLLNWLDEKGQNWRRLEEKQSASWRGKVAAWFEQLFKV